ncbi:hypothetical protein Mycsm_06962 (plasmid) [Mycobacterium sp. JS623]|uniref:hypothetical protein n=1 Tax=Mycobacterium sp. JS623 TaxID=212767 RepID=UPI0002A5A0F0|nr:hypothetical protein [Mycobacterium sp. JS623]AGB27063.1 hypothetical protein Mycsm_06962 [Mycobacterium sp. JS623]
MGFWERVDKALSDARVARTADELIVALNRWHETSSGDAFFAGSGGDNQLVEALDRSIWRVSHIESDYHWTAVSGVDGSSIEYVEGDVYKREAS